ncbi:alpha/beta hydrolase family protein [Horticoccus sp. 23ND18S-11]|uniref:alpha/beta hydrolase family protein n=1 Tax=Horticoccus sp. 23ND18S-11 TaxID=3391832 RepID=UPI0039C97026
MKTKRPYAGCLRRLLCAGILLAATTVASATELFDFEPAFDPAQLTARSVTIAVTNGALEIKGTVPAIDSGVVFPLPKQAQDLSRFRFVEADLENTGDKPLRFTFWALSGHGWGGVSTFTPEGGPAAGREMLAPGQRATFKIDLHTRYPGEAVYTSATDPASIRWLEIVLGDNRNLPSLRVRSIRATGEAPAQVHDASRRVRVPDVTREPAGPGRRVYQQLPGWEKTSVTHVLTLPREWKPGVKYPVIVEYTGNVFYHKFCHSTGLTDQGNLAYGLARGEKFICLNLPFISADGQREQRDGWGDIEKAADYCVAAVRAVCEQFGGDAGAVFFVGFSRGDYAANYLALRDDRIASLWLGFVGTHPGRAWKPADGAGWNKVGLGWDERAARLKGRPWFAAPANLGAHVHVDVEYLEDRPSTVATRRWMQEVLSRRASP